MPNTFTAGNLVSLKSGGPKMTVYSVDGDTVNCVWFNGTTYTRFDFPWEALVLEVD
jgi:uncharacterized protein YodC (DUF2158 family)